MFYEHRLYFEQADLDLLSSGLQTIDIAFLGRACIEIETTPVFQFQTEKRLDEQARKQFLSLMRPSFVSWNNEMMMSYEQYQTRLSILDEAGRKRLHEANHRSDFLRAVYEQAQDDIPTQKDTLTPRTYQKQALRTLYPDLSISERLGLCGLGLSGEVGEVADILKKHLYHRNGKPLDIDKLTDELGDVLWYFFVLLDTLGITIEDVMAANIAKMQARHPNGFHPHYTSDSGASV